MILPERTSVLLDRSLTDDALRLRFRTHLGDTSLYFIELIDSREFLRDLRPGGPTLAIDMFERAAKGFASGFEQMFTAVVKLCRCESCETLDTELMRATANPGQDCDWLGCPRCGGTYALEALAKALLA